MNKYVTFLLFAVLLSACTSTKTIISTENAPAAIGPYSQAVRVNDTLYLSGQIAIDPRSGEVITGDIERETRLVLDNIRAVLKKAEMTMDNVVQAQVFLIDLEHYGVVNKIYGEYFSEEFPARAAVQVARLPKDVSIEIMCIAERKTK